MTVTTLTTKVLVIGAAEETEWLDELPATIAVLKDTTLGDGTIEVMTLDADEGAIEGTTLDADVKTIWLDELLTRAGDVAEDPVFELGEAIWDTGRLLVAPITTATLVAGVVEMVGTELEALLATAATVEGNATWLNELLLT